MSKIFDEIEVSQEVKNFVDRSMEISDQIFTVLQKKGLTQREFAKLLDKKESEVSKWLTGMHNFTLKSISKIEAALGEQIILTPQKAEERTPQSTKFVRVEVTASLNKDLSPPNKAYRTAGSWNERTSEIFSSGIKVA
ncbi:MAG: transcriptional regulator with XRE-family HTH domain [Roseivirga sp.]|jgi:transcriptional regulator with XRE-family HTH domain